uniref:Joining chain of multimeric IgA and IgM n=1 Tax=Chelonoidis abingdonii TaxID=106734 RepID=A0A8C0GTV0_CHEAB
MKTSLLLWGVLAVFLGAALVDEEAEEHVLVDNKCKCARVTSKFVPSKDNPEEDVLVRNIRVICKKCDPTEVELGDRIVTAEQSNNCSSSETCYTYNRNKCYTKTFPFFYAGKINTVQAALTPESCYAD